MTKLSVNINKIATLRNSRGGKLPDVIKAAIDCQAYGADGITVHPRPDQRHIKYEDVLKLKDVVYTEFNIEGNPHPNFMDLVLKIKPTQVTLVPDDDNALTSNAGWDTLKNKEFLKEIIRKLKTAGIRVSIFLDPIEEQVYGAKETETDRIELYTEMYSDNFENDKLNAIFPYINASKAATKLGIGINAGHDLNLDNLNYFYKNIKNLEEVSIGHALICDSLYFGFQNTIQMYKHKLK